MLTASQCATYDEVKGAVMRATGWRDNAATHLGTALISGVVSTTATNPVDVVKTHMFVGEWHWRGGWRARWGRLPAGRWDCRACVDMHAI